MTIPAGVSVIDSLKARSLLLAFFGACVCMGAASILSGCETGTQKRPYGYLKLGHIDQFTARETILPEQRILVIHDEGGYAAMSLMCTHDLTDLTRKEENGAPVYVAEENGSKYDAGGRVLSPPAKTDLPFFRLKFAQDDLKKPPNTLYVQIGREESPAWRLKIP